MPRFPDGGRASLLPGRLAAEATALAASPHAGPYHDRMHAPAETVAAVRRAFPVLGITRLARVTDLDRVGIPVFLAIRPNSRTLAVTQGKGIDDDAAKASAVMEAAEQAIAEQVQPAGLVATVDALQTGGEAYVPPSRFLRKGHGVPDGAIDWIEGFDLLGGRRAWVPRHAVRLDFTERHPVAHPFWQSSDGLAAGNILLEAVLHGLCERIERDASALWSFRSSNQVAARCVDPSAFADPVLSRLATRIADASLCLRLFDITSDIGVPVYFAVIAEQHPTGRDWRHFDLSRGTGCHPIASRAAIRAVTEAAQSRLTAISGARDDFWPGLYDAPLRPDLHVFRLAEPHPIPVIEGPATRRTDLGAILDRLRVRGVRSVVVVPLGGEEFGIAVAKIIVPDLEDPPESRHKRLGRRAVNAMLEAA